MTMLTQAEWLKSILGSVAHFANQEYQRSAWLGLGEAVSSPTEMYNELYDDCSFELYFEQYGNRFSHEQRSTWMGFYEALEKYSNSLGGAIDPQEVLSDPLWAQVRDAASQFLRVFDVH